LHVCCPRTLTVLHASPKLPKSLWRLCRDFERNDCTAPRSLERGVGLGPLRRIPTQPVSAIQASSVLSQRESRAHGCPQFWPPRTRAVSQAAGTSDSYVRARSTRVLGLSRDAWETPSRAYRADHVDAAGSAAPLHGDRASASVLDGCRGLGCGSC
jgi:hypothetical protein